MLSYRRHPVPKLPKTREVGLLGVLLMLVIVVSLRAPHFLRPSNLGDILNDSAVLMMVAAAQFMVMLTAGIDLSVGSNMALVGMAIAMVNQSFPTIPMAVLVVLALLAGLALGSFNGALVAWGRIPAIIATLGTLSIYRGFVFVLSGGEWVSAHEMTEAFRSLTRHRFLGVTSLVLFAVVTLVIMWYFLSHTKTGREIFGVGGNMLASRYTGIRVEKIQYLVFAISGAVAGMGGLLWVARYASAQNETASGFELQTVAACVIGGVSIMGGSGSLPGVLLGALFLGIVYNALTLTSISPFWQLAIQGFVIVAAIVANTLLERRNRRASKAVRSFV